MKDIVKKWLQFAKADLEAAQILFDKADRQGSASQACIFHCHQTIEKMFKAHLISRGEPTPKIHDLVRLEELTQLTLPANLYQFVRDLNPHYQAARYPDLPFSSNFIFTYKQETVRPILENTKNLFLWLKEKLIQNQ